MSHYDLPQPVLTSHELTAHRVGPNRGKQRFDVRSSGNSAQPKGPFTPKRPQHKKRPPNKKPGFDHEQLLTKYRGKEIQLVSTNGAADTVKLIDNDRYTLLIESEGRTAVVFKSALTSVEFPKDEAAE